MSERASGRGKQRLLKALITSPFFDLSTAMWGAPFRRTLGTAAVVKRVVFSVVPLVIACHGSTEGSMGRSWFRLRANQATLARIVDEFVYSDVSGGGWRASGFLSAAEKRGVHLLLLLRRLSADDGSLGCRLSHGGKCVFRHLDRARSSIDD